MADELFMPGRFTDLSEPSQLAILNTLLQDIIEIRPAGTGIRRVDIITKTVTETVNNSSVLQNDDALLSSVGVNETINFMCVIFYNTGTTPDLKFSFIVPSGATINWAVGGAVFMDAAASVGLSGLVTASAGEAEVSGDAQSDEMVLFGTVRNGATSGTLQFQFAQATANASDTSILLDSYMLVWRV